MLCEKSDENWQAFELCRQNGQYNAAANRLYYSVFLAVFDYGTRTQQMDLAETGEARGSRHVDARNLVGRKLGRKCREAYHDLKWLREVADYRPESVTADDLEENEQHASNLRELFLKLKA